MHVQAQPGNSSFRPCVVIPTYDNPATIEFVVDGVRSYVRDVFVIDDASGPEARHKLDTLADRSGVRLLRRAKNGGKGAALKTGFRAAYDAGYTHALQVDGDGQHELADVPTMLQRAQEHPEALVLAQPVFDAGAPRARMWGRLITIFWTQLETGGRDLGDPMCGFRVYPLGATLRTHTPSNRMGYDIEVVVRLVRMGVAVIHVPSRVRYLSEQEGGVSHFRMVRDNAAIAWVHTRLCVSGLFGWLFRPWRRLYRAFFERLPR